MEAGTSSTRREDLDRAIDTRFLADVMLGSLAKWLRILGYDTAYDNRIEDAEIVRVALDENRWVLTRDSRLCHRRAIRHRHLLIKGLGLESQLREVLTRFQLPFPLRLPLSRCLRCNGRLVPLLRSLARPRVPPYVWRTQPAFKQCLDCGRVFWKGTHRERMLEKLRQLRPSTPAAGEPTGDG